MKLWINIFRVVIVIIGIVVLSFNALLYISYEKQKNEISTIGDQQQVEGKINTNRFKYQQIQIEQMSKNLEDAKQQIKDQNDALISQKNAIIVQKDALLQEVEKRHQMENDSKNIQTSLVDIKAEADAIKEDMKGWQKDYVTVLAQLEKKMDDSQDEIKNLGTNLTALNIPELKEDINSMKADIEKMAPPVDNSIPVTPPVPKDKDKSENQS